MDGDSPSFEFFVALVAIPTVVPTIVLVVIYVHAIIGMVVAVTLFLVIVFPLDPLLVIPLLVATRTTENLRAKRI